MLFANCSYTILLGFATFTAIVNLFMTLPTICPAFKRSGRYYIRLLWLEDVELLNAFLQVLDIVHYIPELD